MPSTRPITIRRNLLRNLVTLICLTVGAILIAEFFVTEQALEETSQTMIRRATDHTETQLHRLFRPVERNLKVVYGWGAEGMLDNTDAVGLNRLLMPILTENPDVSSVMVGSADGRGYLLLRSAQEWFNRLTRVEEWGRRKHLFHWSFDGELVSEEDVDMDYDPRLRPWYQDAMATVEEGQVHWTAPYTFFTTKEPGITASVWYTPPDGGPVHVIGFDLLLMDVSRFTTGLDVGEHGKAFVLTETGEVIGLPRDERFTDDDALKAAVLKKPDRLGIDCVTHAAEHWRTKSTGQEGFFTYRSGGERWWADVRPFKLHDRTLWIAVVVPMSDFAGHFVRRRIILLAVTVLAIGVAIVMATRIARKYSRPLEQLVMASERIGSLDLDDIDEVDSPVLELKQLARAQGQMCAALQSFSRYVPMEIVRSLVEMGEVARIGGRTESLTVLFTDIRGFTTIAETMTPQALTDHMAEYFEEMLAILRGYRATIDKFVGDAVVAFWGAPLPDADHAVHGVGAALSCRDQLAELNAKWQSAGRPALPTCFGLDTGTVVVGNVGAPSRLNYTALGDTVNVAARIEGVNRLYGTEILGTEAIRAAAGDAFLWRLVDRVYVLGRREAIDAYELLGSAGQVPDERVSFARTYEAAFELYQSRRFSEAAERIAPLAQSDPDDASVQYLLSKCQTFGDQPPGDDWDGVRQLQQK